MSDFEFDDGGRERRTANRQTGNFRTGFGCAFGGMLGIAAAVVLVLVMVAAGCAGLVGFSRAVQNDAATTPVKR